MHALKRESFASAYGSLLWTLRNEPVSVSPRGQETREIEDLHMELPLSDGGAFANEARGTDLRYLAGEILWYLTARRDLAFISRYSSFWEKVSPPNGLLNSAYGHSLFVRQDSSGERSKPTEWQWALRSLATDPDSRQAWMTLHLPRHHWPGNPDVPCTTGIHLTIRGGRLDVRTHMRSSDVWYGLPFDVPFFMLLGNVATRLLAKTYPHLLPGRLIHKATSTHLYERDAAKVDAMLRHPIMRYPIPYLDVDAVSEAGTAHRVIRTVANDVTADPREVLGVVDRVGSRWLSWLARCALASKERTKTEARGLSWPPGIPSPGSAEVVA